MTSAPRTSWGAGSPGKLDVSTTSTDSQPIQVGDVAAAVKHFAPVSKAHEKLATTQRKAANALSEAFSRDDNAAIRDIGRHTAELLKICAQEQMRMAHEHERAVSALSKMCDCEDTVRRERNDLNKYMKEEARLIHKLAKAREQKEPLRSSSLWGNAKPVDVLKLDADLNDTRRQAAAARTRLTEAENEQQVVRMFRLREALRTMSTAVIANSRSMSIIFSATQNLAECVPAISTQNPRSMDYTEGARAAHLVAQAKEQLHMAHEENGRDNSTVVAAPRRNRPSRRSEPLQPCSHTATQNEPPVQPPSYAEALREQQQHQSCCTTACAYCLQAGSPATPTPLNQRQQNRGAGLYPNLSHSTLMPRE